MDWYFYWLWLAIINCITFLFYGFDKAASKMGIWRVPEIFLHLMALSGGFIGGWAGRWMFRHKTKKRVFIFVIMVGAMIHLGLILLYTVY